MTLPARRRACTQTGPELEALGPQAPTAFVTRAWAKSGLEDELQQTAAELDAFSWTALLCAFEKGQRWQESIQVLQDSAFP